MDLALSYVGKLALLHVTTVLELLYYYIPGGCHMSQWPSLPLCWHPMVQSQRDQPTFSAEKIVKQYTIINIFMTVSLQQVTIGSEEQCSTTISSYTLCTILLRFDYT